VALEPALRKCYTERYLRLCRQFYGVYPEIRKSLISEFKLVPIRKSLISKFPLSEPAAKPVPSALPAMAAEKLLTSLSFTHFLELIKIDDPLKRAFYEIECIKGTWSVREFKRQISSLYYERSGLSLDKKKLSQLTQSLAEADTADLIIRDPYVFEFLGVKSHEVMHESNLELALLNKLQAFLLELGRGFCFEARQRRILIGAEHFFVDLVFYHRILKCHVLIELKVATFTHEHLGQLNTYVNWYRENEMTPADNSPVGILLCTDKNHPLVQYALAGMDNQLFVSKYQLELPEEKQIQAFLEEQLRETDRRPEV
jgi:predicted nuclease of restriction endonuclease-like (RecB) superfamily